MALSRNFKIRKLTKNDIKEAVKLVLSEGWNQTADDWHFMVDNSENLCFAAETNGKLVATVIAMVYSGKLAWIGMVLVNKKWRGQGIAKQLFSVVLQEVKSIKSVKLDATPAGKLVYEKFGFRDEFRILRMVRKPNRFETMPKKKIILQKIMEDDLLVISKFDQETFGVSRPALLNFLQNDSNVKDWCVKQGNRIDGFIFGRTGNKHVQIGPVAATSTATVIALISKSLKELSYKSVVVDILEDKTDLIDWMNSVGFEVQRTFTRMYLNEIQFPGKPENQYSICGPEFG